MCSGCGTREEEWEEDPIAYVPSNRRCPGCELLEMEREDESAAKIKGLKTFLVPTAMERARLEAQDGLDPWEV